MKKSLLYSIATILICQTLFLITIGAYFILETKQENGLIVSGPTVVGIGQGGTGWSYFNAGVIPIGNYNARFATSSNFTFATSSSRLTVTYASSTAISASTICIGTDCQTSWPAGITSATYPLIYTGGVLSTAFSTTTANTFSALQTMSGGINVPSGVLGYSMEGILLAYASSTNFNTIFGLGAGGNTATTSATAEYNTFIGYQAGSNLASGAIQNTFLGYRAGYSSSTASTNVADKNTGIGERSLYSNTTGFQNTATGVGALYFNTTGYKNTANGMYALLANTTGYKNTAIGMDILSANTTGDNNTASGMNALFSNTTGNNNTANGMYALYSNISGSSNVALGYMAGQYEFGSNAFYVNNQERTNTAGDKANSLLYGTFAAASADQNLTVNAHLNVTGTSTFTDLLTTTNASSTLFSTSYASSTQYHGADLQTCNSTTGKLTWTNGQFACGTDYNTGGGTGGPGTISTSTSPTISGLAYWTSKDAWPETLGTVGTSTPTITAPLAYSGTLGNFVGGASGAFTCTTAASGVAGCLSNTAFDTFNNKQATISATWPITLTGAAVGFNGLSTSTVAVLGNIPYFSGVNTFANVATSTVTASAPLVFSNTAFSVIGAATSNLTCTAASGSVAGCLASANFTSFNQKVSTSSIDSILDINTMLDGEDVASTTWIGASSITTLGTIGTGVWNGTDIGLAYIAGGVADANVYDFGGATSFEIPNGAAMFTNTTGQMAIDTTSGQLRWNNGSATSTVTGFYTMVANMASSTWGVATTTLYMGPALANLTVQSVRCETSAGTLWMSLWDGTNRANLVSASTTIGNFTYSTNNTFTAGESIRVDYGTAASSPTQVTCRYKVVYDPD